MLPLLYSEPGVPQKVADDPQSAPIPELHKLLFRWSERFVQSSWDLGPEAVDELRAFRLSDADIAHWAQIACLQTWWVMSADGGGIPLEGDAVTGFVVGRKRESYEAVEGGQTAAELGALPLVREPAGLCWIQTNETGEPFEVAAAAAEARYGFVPNLLRAVSLDPAVLPRHTRALELLDAPQSQALSPRQHALVRVLVSCLNRCAYSAETTRALLARVAGEPDLYAQVTEDYTRQAWSVEDRVVLDFATRMVRNSYKVTEKDAIAFRECGLGDEAYIDVLNTVSIQTSLDRLANALGVAPDALPILPA